MPAHSPGTLPPAWVIAESAIHGRGLFASRAIAAGERIVDYRGEKITKAESARRATTQAAIAHEKGIGVVYTVSLDDEYDLDGSALDNPARYANHACSPNCELHYTSGTLWLIAVHDIAAGAELTFDYSYDLRDYFAHPCRCGTAGCAGYIVRADLRMKLRAHLARARRHTRTLSP
ncbi:MAG: SET domain-containing protein-lysine N-methyltransferase [Verrucomicrobiota bacterium]|nr:SET domain-containing protein-lysine N-methyltransferase [Verrucomicrobiota bacterium]